MADDLGSAAGMIAGKAVEGNLLDKINQMENRIAALEGANTVMADVGEVTDDLGDIRAGRILALSSGYEPTDADATGVVIDAAGIVWGADTYNLVGVNAGVLQFGLSATDGKAYFMGGAAIMDDGGINLTGVGNLITMEGSTETATRHVNIGMEIGPDTGVPSLTIKSYSPDYGSNLLTNGTFESDTVGSAPANWTNNYTVVQSASGTFTSNYLRFLYSGYNDRNDYSDAINVTEGTTYCFIYHAYIYALAGSPSNIAWSRLRITWYDVSNALISTTVINQAYSISDTPDYHDIHAVWSGIAPTGAVTAKINLNYWGKQDAATTPIGYILVDDLTFCDLSGEATYQIQFDPELTVYGGLTVNGGIAGALTGNVTGNVKGTLTGAVNTPLITLTDGNDPASPSAGYRALYAKSNGIYQKVSGGTVSRLALASEIPTLTYPKRFAVMGDEITTAVSNWGFSAVASMQYGGFWTAPAANSNNGDEYTFGAYLCAGTYTLYHLGRKASDKGIIDWYIDGSAITGGANRDWYAATAVTYIDSFSVTVAASGHHVFKAKVDGHNKSSSDYNVAITKIWLKQATD